MTTGVEWQATSARANLRQAAEILPFVCLLATALFGPVFIPCDPLESNTHDLLSPPSPAHWFGTDQLGRDVFSRVVAGARHDLAIAAGSVVIAFGAGTLAGIFAGFYGGWVDHAVGRLTDALLAFPMFVLALGIVAALGNSVTNVVVASAIANLPFYIRLARSEVAVLRQATFVEAARMGGCSDLRIIFRHLAPQLVPLLAVQGSLNLGWAMLNAAGLSFIGLGVRPPTPEWGQMVAEGANFLVSGEWWLAFFPGLALMLAVLSFSLLGDALGRRFDPQQRD